MYKQINTLSPYRIATAFFVVVFIIAAMCTLTSCAGLAKGAGCQNGYVGYGEKPQVIKGPHR